MTWSYDDTDLSTDKNKVRFLVGDTDTNDQLVSDEEIAYALTVNSNPFSASAIIARSIQSKFSRLADTSIEFVAVKYSQKAKAYAALVKDLESAASEQDLPDPSVFGINTDDIQDNRNTEDRVQERFYKDQFSNPPSDTSNDDNYTK